MTFFLFLAGDTKIFFGNAFITVGPVTHPTLIHRAFQRILFATGRTAKFPFYHDSSSLSQAIPSIAWGLSSTIDRRLLRSFLGGFSAQAKPHGTETSQSGPCFLFCISQLPRFHETTQIELPAFIILEDVSFIAAYATTFLAKDFQQNSSELFPFPHIFLLFRAFLR
jgi:hypothetical protein